MTIAVAAIRTVVPAYAYHLLIVDVLGAAMTAVAVVEVA